MERAERDRKSGYWSMSLHRWITAVSFAAALHAETLRVPLGLDAYVPAPESNPLTRERVELGRELFFFKGLSRDGTLSCGGCHVPTRAFTDGGRTLSR